MENVIETRGLRKEYRDKVAVADLSLTVKKGEVFGFLGPNGAGKTTSVKMLLGLVHPSKGDGTLLGAELGDSGTRSKIGFLPEHFRFHRWLTGREFLKLHGELLGIAKPEISRRTDELLELVGLEDAGRKKLQAFSKGMLQRIGLAQALLNDPDLVILDEPTSGLDPLGRRLVRDIIRDLRELGSTVFINSHLLSEIEVTCDRVAFIKEGEIVRTVELAKLSEGQVSIEIHADKLTAEIANGLQQFASSVEKKGEKILLTVGSDDLIPAVNRYLVENGVEVYSLRPERASLEDLFVKIMGEAYKS